MKITPNFALAEFACRDGSEYPREWIETRLRPLCLVLEKLREVVGMPIQISSGFRTYEYNKKIGGAYRSQHVQGTAADVIVKGYEASEVADVLQTLHDNKIIRIGGLGRYPGFCHVDIRFGKRLAHWTGGRVSN